MQAIKDILRYVKDPSKLKMTPRSEEQSSAGIRYKKALNIQNRT